MLLQKDEKRKRLLVCALGLLWDICFWLIYKWSYEQLT